MSLFETLKKAIFHNPLAPATTSSSAAPSASASTSAAGARPTQAPQPAAPATPVGSATAPAANVDVEALLDALNAKSPQTLNWRTSIVDLMKLVGLDPSLQHRQQLASELGYTGDKSDTASMNIWLHKAVMRKLAENGGKVPATLQ